MSRTPDLPTTMQMYARYEAGLSIAGVADEFEQSRQSVYGRFKGAKLKLRTHLKFTHRAKGIKVWDGRRYGVTKDGYFRCTSDRERNGRARRLLHWDMWEKANGRVKRGWVVRFVDGDRMNTEIDNLEAVPRCEMHQPKPIEMKPCLACGEWMGRRATGNHPEGPSAYAKRKTCNAQCSAAWKKGKPKGSRMPGNHA